MGRRDFGEADRILIVYTKSFGKVSLLAKGVRRPKSRKRGHIEVFNFVRFQSTEGRGINLMTEAEVIDDFKEIRRSLKRISLAYYLMEVTGRITHEGEPNVELFNLILETLTMLKKATELRKLRLNFVNRALVILGFWPKDRVLPDPDEKLEEVIERQIYSERVGRRMIQ